MRCRSLRALVDVEHQLAEVDALEPGEHRVDGGSFLGDEQHLPAPATRAAIRLAMVWLLPVPGGPWITRLRPDSTAPIALRWEESASRTE